VTNNITVSSNSISLGSVLEASGQVSADGKPLPNAPVALHMGDITVANTQTDQNGRYAFSVPVGANYFPAAFSNGVTVYTVVEPHDSSFVDTPSAATSVPVNLAPLFAIIALIAAAVVTVCYLFVWRFREKGSAVVRAAKPSRRAAQRVTLKSVNVTSKGLRETLRDRRGFVFLLGLPILLIILFSFAFGSATFLSGGSLPHSIVVINNDAGAVATGTNNTTRYVNYGSNFTQVLMNATAENSSTKLFALNNVSYADAENLLRSRSTDALIIIPKNFSSAFVSMVNNSTRTAITSSVGQQAIANAANSSAFNSLNPVTATAGANVTLPAAGNVSSALIIEGDSGYVNFGQAQFLLTAIFDQYRNTIAANAAARAAPGGAATVTNNTIPAEIQSIPGTQSFTLFDYMVPGLIVLALLLQVTSVATSLVRDIEGGILDRLKLSKMRAFDLLFGTLVTWSIITVAQVLILIAVAIALGYHHQGDLSSLGLAALIGVIVGMASISLALIIASFTKSERQALSLSAMIAVPLSFLAGAFFPLPPQAIEFWGATYSVYGALPWTHAVSSLRGVLTYGTGLSGFVVGEMAWLIVLTAILFVVGVVVFSQVRLRVEK
jgi:ABC-2 type transport system permease protein